MTHPSIKNKLIAYTCKSVADALDWKDLDTFERIDLPSPGLFALRSGRRVLLAIGDDRPGGGVRLCAEDRERSLAVERLVSMTALRAFNGDFGEAARIDAAVRFKRLQDVDLAVDRTPRDANGLILYPPPDKARGCQAGADGECNWSHCPQLRDNEPRATGRHCPLDKRDDE